MENEAIQMVVDLCRESGKNRFQLERGFDSKSSCWFSLWQTSVIFYYYLLIQCFLSLLRLKPMPPFSLEILKETEMLHLHEGPD